ncbi:GMC oxidoreductase [Acanthamoeba polyphaga moumouvirus]|uniref:GMC oxidoreductase n=2 Tax=Moumouvirus TaxID=3080801 RepID=L7RDY4_9VIRU|nr:GMC oxidoreductase [Acanthamoeba polyphaga moumouvirus]AEX62323.1 putative GMC-type oxidoreductase [Moumouvirus Monve]AGC02318.1 GMC oxidoreductase [Acanthamoeba polyphaga moumouvirus]AQN68664.1 GMc oxidoreductase [Saudi moumouvirus]
MNNRIISLFVVLALLAVSTSSLPVCRQGTFGSVFSYPDYVIVGSGPGGSVALNKCISAGHKCTLVERGLDYFEVPFVSTPSASFLVYSSPAVIYVETEPLRNIFNKTVSAIEPFVVGGASSVNGMIAVFPDIDVFYDQLNITGWSYEEMLPYYLNLITSVNRPEYHGPLNVTDTSPNEATYQAFRNAIRQVFPNIPEKLPDMNTASINSSFYGFGPAETTTKTTFLDFGGVAVPIVSYRESAYMAFVHELRHHPNFRLMTRSRVDRVVFDSCGTTAKKVEVTVTNYFGVQYQCELRAQKGIILAAGAIRTPQILLQSGIGPANELSALGIPVIKNLPDVGRHLDDHPTVVRQFLGTPPDNYYSSNINGHAYWNIEDNPNVISNWAMQISGVPGINLKNVLSVQQNQASRGSVRLRSNNPSDNPRIDLGHLNDLSDLEIAAVGFNKTNQVVENLQYINISPIVCPSFLPDCTNNITDYYYAAYLQYASSGYHYTGTTAFGKVVNPNNGLVYGFENLYVVDAGNLPRTPRGNTQISTYVLSTKLSESIF